ncbi:MAG: ATP-dependent helicase, partial [Scytonema sp. PMC 1069.18]|nr:ATP-dependent helicase [Scytonema sp. PMC 1069.18]
MKVIHGTWIPDTATDYIQPGSFYLWVETPLGAKRHQKNKQIHPGHLTQEELEIFLTQELGIKESAEQLRKRFTTKYFALPTANHQPLPSPELTKYLEEEFIEEYEGFQYWQINCYEAVVSTKANSSNSTAINIIKLLNEIHFLALYNS